MKIDIEAVEKSGADSTGTFAAVGVRGPSQARHMLRMPFAVAAELIAALCEAAKRALDARCGGAGRVKTTDFEVEPTSVGAGMLPTGGRVVLVLQFGQLSMSASLDATSAQTLAEELVQAATQGSPNLQ